MAKCLITDYMHPASPIVCPVKMVSIIAVEEYPSCPCPVCGEELQPTGPAVDSDDPEEVVG
jgi:hypothetical protein